jgi:hypothetical protein
MEFLYIQRRPSNQIPHIGHHCHKWMGEGGDCRWHPEVGVRKGSILNMKEEYD